MGRAGRAGWAGGQGECVQDRQGARRPYPSVGVAPSSSAAASPSHSSPPAVRNQACLEAAGRPAGPKGRKEVGGLATWSQKWTTGGPKRRKPRRALVAQRPRSDPPTPSAALTAALIVAPSSPRSPFLTRPVGRLAVGGPHGSKRLRPAAVQASCHLGGQLFFMDTQARCRDTKATQTRLCATYRQKKAEVRRLFGIRIPA